MNGLITLAVSAMLMPAGMESAAPGVIAASAAAWADVLAAQADIAALEAAMADSNL